MFKRLLKHTMGTLAVVLLVLPSLRAQISFNISTVVGGVGGSNPSSIAYGDFNGDGRIDLVTANNGIVGNISVMLGTGGGDFGIPVNYTVSPNPTGITVADFNNDTHLDIAVCNFSIPKIDVFTGTGTGTFNFVAGFVHSGTASRHITHADVNGDGRPDLLVANFFSGDVSVLTNTGMGTFVEIGTVLSMGALPVFVAAGHFNTDTHIDFAVVNSATTNVAVFTGSGTGSFSAAGSPYPTGSPGARPVGLVIADFNNDTRNDFAVANSTANDFVVFTNTGGSMFASAGTYPVALSFNPSAISAMSYNADTHPDIVLAGSGSNSIAVFTNTGTGAFATMPVYLGTGTFPQGLAVADFNNDSRSDVATVNTGSNNVWVFTNSGANLGVRSLVNTDSRPRAVVLRDITGDGRLDMIAADNGSGSITVFSGTGTNAFVQRGSYRVGFQPRSIALGNFNGDAFPDAVVANYAGNNISILLGAANGTFGNPANYSSGLNPNFVITRDLNGDGFDDVISVDQGSDQFSIWTATGTGAFSSVGSFPTTGSSPTSIAIGYINADALLDIVITKETSNDLDVYPGTGPAAFGPPYTLSLGNGSAHVSLADFNADGWLDAAVVNKFSNDVSVLLNDGLGALTPHTVYSTGNQPSSLLAVDVNGDGALDLVTTNESDDQIAVLTGTGTGAFGTPMMFSVGTNPSFVAGGDINLDTRLDLVVVNQFDDEIYGHVLLNTTPFPQSIVGFNPPIFMPYGDVYMSNATATSGLPVTYVSEHPTIVSFVGNNMIAKSTGLAIVHAIQPGGGIYGGVTVTSGITVTPRPATVLGFNATKVYGEANPAFSGTVIGLVMGDTYTLDVTSPATTTSNPGTYPIIPNATITSAPNYSITYINGVLTVTPRPATVVGFTLSRPYGDANPFPLGTVVGIIFSDMVAFGGSTPATIASPPGMYPISAIAVGPHVGKYTFTTVAGSITVTPRSATVVGFNDTRQYGDPNPVFFGAILNSVAGDNLTFGASTSATTMSPVGTYPIVVTVTGPDAFKYAFTPLNATLTVTHRPAIVTADNATRIYGDPNPVFTGSIMGTITGDAVSFLGVTTAVPLSPVGTYPITATLTGASASNYTVIGTNGTLTVTGRPATILGYTLTRAYGDSNPTLGTILGVATGDNIFFAGSTTATASSAPGTYPITNSVAGTSLSFYDFVHTITGSLEVTPRPATVLGITHSRLYGDDNPTVLGSLVNVITGDDVVLSASTTAAASSAVGSYPVNVAVSGSDVVKYTFTTVPGTIQVVARPATVIGFNASRPYGEPNPVFSGTVIGLVLGDAISFSGSTPATASSNPGTYAIVATATGIGLSNYTFTLIDGVLTITKLTQTITGLNLPAGVTLPGTSSAMLTATATSGLDVSYNVSGPAVIVGQEISFTGIGLVTVVALQPGDAIYEPADSVVATVQVVSLSGTGQIITVPSGIIAGSVAAIVKVYPSPNHGDFYIESTAPVGFTIIDVLGRTVLSESKESYLHHIQGIQPGLYIIKTSNGAMLKVRVE